MKTQLHHFSGGGNTSLVASLGDGQAYTTKNGITVRQIAHGTDYADIELGGTCLAGTPVLAVEPASQEVAAAGSTARYQIRLTNKDTQFCAGTTFSLSAAGPALGWNLALSTSTVTLGGGASGIVATLDVTAPLGTSEGSYDFSVQAADGDGAAPAHTTASATGSYAIDLTPPAAVTTLAASSGRKGVTLQWSRPDDGVLFQLLRNGTLLTTTSALSYIDNSAASCTTYTYTAVALDAFNRPSAAGNTVTFTTSCKGPKRR